MQTKMRDYEWIMKGWLGLGRPRASGLGPMHVPWPPAAGEHASANEYGVGPENLELKFGGRWLP